MNIKKILTKAVACSFLATSLLTTCLPVKASEITTPTFKTLVLICPRVEIQQTNYNPYQTTLMNPSEVERVKADAQIMETTVNQYACGNVNMDVDVIVSEQAITSKTLSMSYGPTINTSDVENILDTYAPDNTYDSILLVYRDKDYSTSLATSDITLLPSNETNNSIYSTVKLDDADHSMNFVDNNYPMYLIDRLSDGLYKYFKSQGFDLDSYEFPPYVDGDLYQYNKAKRNWYRYYFAGMKWTTESKGGITKDMWPTLPTNN